MTESFILLVEYLGEKYEESATLGLAHLLRGLLFGISPNDAATLCAAAGLLIAVAMLATYLPARAATRIDPVVALGWE